MLHCHFRNKSFCVFSLTVDVNTAQKLFFALNLKLILIFALVGQQIIVLLHKGDKSIGTRVAIPRAFGKGGLDLGVVELSFLQRKLGRVGDLYLRNEDFLLVDDLFTQLHGI